MKTLIIVKSLCLGFFFCGAIASTAVAQDNASFKLDHYSMTLGRDGVTRQTSYSENLYRNGSQLIYARNIPASVNQQVKLERHEERHFDSSLSPQLITLNKNGDVQFTFLDVNNKVRIEVPKVEFQTVGFSGSWINSFSLIDPTILKKMQKKGAGTVANTTWYEQVNEKGITRILWDEKNKIATHVEFANKEGTIKNVSKSELISLNSTNPLFTSSKNFTSKVISDYRD